jgi:arsenite-transporting ATPase
MSTIEVFEPAMCCSTGVCGPDVPQDLVAFSADLDWLRGQGTEVTRVNLAGEPTAFTGNPVVLSFLTVSGSQSLPLVLVDGSIAMAGRYPTRGELARWAGAETTGAGLPTAGTAAPMRTVLQLAAPAAEGGCGCGGGSC